MTSHILTEMKEGWNNKCIISKKVSKMHCNLFVCVNWMKKVKDECYCFVAAYLHLIVLLLQQWQEERAAKHIKLMPDLHQLKLRLSLIVLLLSFSDWK